MLTIPEQNLTSLSFCNGTLKDLENWVQSLPMANIGETARRLYHAVIELNQFPLSPEVRQQYLERVRGPIYFVCDGLSRHFLNQSIVLPEKQRKVANLAQALQLHLATGYKIVVVEGQSGMLSEKTRKAVTVACHRAISDLSQTIVRACQLYCTSPPSVWMEIHQLYRFAQKHNLLGNAVRDPLWQSGTTTRIPDAYKRILLLGCSKPNQLRQNDIAGIYDAFAGWVEHIKIDSPSSRYSLFVLNTLKDAPPVYRSLHHGAVTDDFYGLDCSELTDLMTEYLALLKESMIPPEGILPMPTRLPDRLIIHLHQAFGLLTKRTFKRIASKGKLSVCVGLSATHHYCSDGMSFNLQLVGGNKHGDTDDGNNLFARRMKQKDVWSGARDVSLDRDESFRPDLTPINYTGISNRLEAPETEKENVYKQFRVPLVNTSPGGYCLQWNGELPGNVQAGEILGVREEEHHPWSIATIRWIRQVKQQGTQIGIELLAPSAIPCAIQLIQRAGENSEYLRGLLLPELSAIGQPATLIAPRLPFQTGHRVIINQMGQERKALLNRRFSATASFTRFEFSDLNGDAQTSSSESPGRAKTTGSEFDSLWSSL